MNSGVRGFLGLLVAGALLYGLQHTTPYYGDITSPVPVTGKPGQRIDTEVFALEVARIHVAREVAIRSFNRVKTYSTSGLWVLAEAVGEAGSQSISLLSAQWLGANGVRYGLSERLSTLPAYLPSQRLEPGLPRPVLMAFEIPESQASNGTLLVTPSSWKPLEPEARIEMPPVRPEDVRPVIEIARGDAARPWKLSGGQ
jgi:hypothetical protein